MKPTLNHPNRRQFAKTTFMTGATLAAQSTTSILAEDTKQRRIRTGVIGCGSVSHQYLPVLKRPPFVDVVSLCDIRHERAVKQGEKFKVANTYPDIDAMLAGESFDFLVNLTNMQEHEALNRRALDAGKHVWSEKPIANSLEAGQQLLRIATEKGLRLKALGAIPMSVLGYERRYNSALRDALAGKEDAFVKDILSGQPEPPRYFARMKRDNKAGPALLQDGRLPSPRPITTSELVTFIGDTAHPKTVIDLRGDREAFMQAHVEGSLFAPFASGKLPLVAGSYVDEDAAIILVVNEASEVDEAVRQLVRIGLDNIESWIPTSEALSDHVEEANILTHQSNITTAGLSESLANHPDAVVLDVRSAAEYAESHVRGAEHIAYTRLAVRLAEVPEGSPLFVHCATGLRASLAVPFLARHREVIHVDGDFSDISDSLIEQAISPVTLVPASVAPVS